MPSDRKPRSPRETLAAYQRPSHARSAWELAITAGPLVAVWGLALFALSRGWLWGVLLAIPAAGFLVRLFMIQHDCGHGAFLRPRAGNDWIGRIAAVFTVTPYDYWRRTHAIHHATSGNLDRRGLGAVEIMTVEEYRALGPLKRLGYRIYRNPLVMFGLGPAYMFVLQHRLPIGLMKDGKAWLSVMGVNLGLAVLLAVEIAVGGVTGALAFHLATLLLAGAIGVWLFYVQHQFEGAYWARQGAWSYDRAALDGSSHLVLPPVLRWFTANIGAHHIHHLGSKIPFYRLPAVMRAHPELKGRRVTLAESFGFARLTLWDEAGGRLVTFRKARQLASAANV